MATPTAPTSPRTGPAPALPAEPASAPPRVQPSRTIVEVVSPVVDGGRFPAKATVGEPVPVVADVFMDGHDHPDASLFVCAPGSDGETGWNEIPMEPQGNDRWLGWFTPDRLGVWTYRVSGWHARWA